mmetsp:Transcript_29497/g.83193  ORF Transcript_29497/g.83193 Transcript_29497/m.83193 type:complete len:608 (-) Transcript_29497:76-1899(-)
MPGCSLLAGRAGTWRAPAALQKPVPRLHPADGRLPFPLSSSNRLANPQARTHPTRKNSRLIVQARRGGGRRRAPGRWHRQEPESEFGYRKDFDDIYTIGGLLGQGGFGSVHQVTEKESGRNYAVKTILKEMNGTLLSQEFSARVRCEVDTLMLLAGSLNTAFLYNCFEDKHSVMLVFDLLSGGTLRERIDTLTVEGRFPEADARQVSRNIMQMLAQCHAMGVLHRDIKPENFLYSCPEPDAPLKAIDFGAAAWYSAAHPPTERVGTPIYMSPEVVKAGVNLRDPGYDFKADIYSAGVLFYFLLVGKWPYSGEVGTILNSSLTPNGGVDSGSLGSLQSADIFQAVIEEEIDFSEEAWEGISADALDFVRPLLEKDPANRPTAIAALEHRFLQRSSALDDSSDEFSNRGVKEEVVQRLQRYGTYPRLKRMALAEMVELLPANKANELSDLQDMFHSADTNGDGELSTQEILDAVARKKLQLSPMEVEQLLIPVDLNFDGAIQYKEWVAALTDWKEVMQSGADGHWDEWVAHAFSSLGGTGETICDERLKEIMGSELRKMMPSTVKDTMRLLDTNHDGMLSLDEFRCMLESRELDLDLFPSREESVTDTQ